MANNTQLAPRDQKLLEFKAVINDKSIRNRIRTSMGENAGNFIASMLDLYESETALQNYNPVKVAMECLKAASLNLPIVKGLGFAYVVPYGGTPTFVVGYKGLIQLAQRSGQYRYLNADAVYEGEEIKANRFSGQLEITGTKTSDKAVGYFAYFQLNNGFEKTIYMTVEDIQAYGKKYSKAFNNGPWKTNFDEMAKKTMIRQILKYGPMSTDIQNAEKIEVQNAETVAQMDVNRNANQGAVIDVPVGEVRDSGMTVDESTGEVIDGPATEGASAEAPSF